MQHVTDYGNMMYYQTEKWNSVSNQRGVVAGLGVVVSKYAAHDLDTSLPFVTVIPDDKWEDIEYVQMKLIENRKISVTMRKEIRQYGIDNFLGKVSQDLR